MMEKKFPDARKKLLEALDVQQAVFTKHTNPTTVSAAHEAMRTRLACHHRMLTSSTVIVDAICCHVLSSFNSSVCCLTS
jgi:hypothetical protein